MKKYTIYFKYNRNLYAGDDSKVHGRRILFSNHLSGASDGTSESKQPIVLAVPSLQNRNQRFLEKFQMLPQPGHLQ